MEQLFEFITNHPLLVTTFFALLTLLIWSEGNKGGKTISTAQLTQKVNKENALVLDVRDAKDFTAGRIVDAINIPHAKVADRISELDKERAIIIVDAMGQNSGGVGKTLSAAGFETVMRLQGGINSWKGDNLPLIKS